MSNKENLLLRIKAVQVLDQLYYRKGEHLYSHHRVWRNHARRIFGINYTTYASYLRRDVSQLSDRPEVAGCVVTRYAGSPRTFSGRASREDFGRRPVSESVPCRSPFGDRR